MVVIGHAHLAARVGGHRANSHFVGHSMLRWAQLTLGTHISSDGWGMQRDNAHFVGNTVGVVHGHFVWRPKITPASSIEIVSKIYEHQ